MYVFIMEEINDTCPCQIADYMNFNIGRCWSCWADIGPLLAPLTVLPCMVFDVDSTLYYIPRCHRPIPVFCVQLIACEACEVLLLDQTG